MSSRGCRAAIWCCVVFGMGCSGGDVERELASALSSVATASMALGAWSGNRVPSPFATRILRESADELSQVRESLAQEPSAPALQRVIESALGTTQRAARAVGEARPDTATALASRVTLDSLASQLRALQARMESGEGEPP